jgi:hypothetical protein
MKIAYGYGLRFNELRHLQTVDFARNPHAREFGAFGVCKVRYGLLKAGWDPRFVQDQMGHEYASTTGIYQFTSDEFRRSTLRAALDRTVTQAIARGNKDGRP